MPPYCTTPPSPAMIYESPSSSSACKPEMPHTILSHSHEKLRSVSYDEDERVTKSVSFAPQAELYLIPHYNELSDEEFDATYMNRSDYNRIDKENIQTVKEMLNGSYPQSDELYFRGLENSMSQSSQDRKQRIKFIVFHVLQEQYNNQGVMSDEWIESVRYHYTSKSAEFAYKMGVWDYEAMREDLINDAKFMSPIVGSPKL